MSDITRTPIDLWEASLLRYSAFLGPKSSPDTTKWWNSVVGQPPESVMGEPRSNIRRDAGLTELGGLQLTTQPFRVDWHVVPEDVVKPMTAPQTKTPTIGKLTQVIAPFLELVDKAIAIEKLDIFRVALGVTCELPRDNHEHAYLTLNSYLPVKVDADSSDFLYQVNRRRSSRAVDGLVINRLSKWNVMKASNFFFDVTTQSAKQEDIGLFTCRTELDINNVPQSEKFLTADEISKLMREFFEHGADILLKGDTP